jgi:hypothetical protein
VNFCKRVREVGGKVYIDNRLNVQHKGGITYPVPGTW